MEHIYVNFKRFDVPASLGGVNRLSECKDYGRTVVERTKDGLRAYEGKAEFAFFLPEAQIPGALEALGESSILSIGCQGVFRRDVAPGGNFGAFTTSRTAASMKALGCSSVIIGHCEERNDKNELLSLGGSKDRNLVNRILNEEVLAAQRQGLEVLYCVGEKDTELEDWDRVIAEQLETGLKGADLSSVAVAYEPVWSIGPGKTPAGKEYITKVARLIKRSVGDVPVVYGGGLKEANAAMLSSIEEINGGLIALTRFAGEIGFYPEEYLEIVNLYMGGRK